MNHCGICDKPLIVFYNKEYGLCKKCFFEVSQNNALPFQKINEEVKL